MIVLFAVLFGLAVADPPATIDVWFGCNYPWDSMSNLILYSSISVIGNWPNYIINPITVTSSHCAANCATTGPYNRCGRRVAVQTRDLPTNGLAVTLSVSEHQVSVSRTFYALPGQTYSWTNVTAELTVNIEDWNPWCVRNPTLDPGDVEIFNAAKLALQVTPPGTSAPDVFREYSAKGNNCGNDVLPWSYFPLLPAATGVSGSPFPFGLAGTSGTQGAAYCANYGTRSNPGSFHTPVKVDILATTWPVTVYAGEYRNSFSAPATAQECFEVFSLGHTAPGFPTSASGVLGGVPAGGGRVQYTTDTDCSDNACNSGLLIARLQIPNRCYEPTQDLTTTVPLGQQAYIAQGTGGNLATVGGGVGRTQFPRTAILETWDSPNFGIVPYRWHAGADNVIITDYVLSTDLIQVFAQWGGPGLSGAWDPTPLTPSPTIPGLPVPTTARGVKFLRNPTASCYTGYCEAQPITSTLHVQTQGECARINTISITQQVYNSGTNDFVIQDFVPDCTQVVNDELLFCVFNNQPTRVTINYNLRGTSTVAAVPTGGDINCRVANQTCWAPGGLAKLCPNFGCLFDGSGNGPTQLNFAVVQYGAPSYTLYDSWTATAAQVNAVGGCWWVPALPNLTFVASEGCCALPTTSAVVGGYTQQYTTATFPSFYTGAGCVQYWGLTAERVGTALNQPPGCAGASRTCTTIDNFGRTLAAFDLAYLPKDDDMSTVSVSLENPVDCAPFRFKTSQGGAPRCYCVLPIVVKPRIIETNLQTNAQACECHKQVSCVTRYADRDQDCTMCEFLSSLNFDLRGLPPTTQANLWVGPYVAAPVTPGLAQSTPPHTGFLPLRMYPRYVGDVNNFVSVLQVGNQIDCGGTGLYGCPQQTYCVQAIDNAAQLTICVTCDFKTCRAYDFTRDLCIDLTNPCPNGATNRLFDVTLSLNDVDGLGRGLDFMSVWPLNRTTPRSTDQLSSFVRTIGAQGGVNGCATRDPNLRRRETYEVRHDELEPEQMAAMTEEDLMDWEAANTMESLHASVEKRDYVSSVAQGHYTVLRLPNYDVTVFEQNVRVTRPVNCSGSPNSAPGTGTDDSCSPTNLPEIGYLTCLCWNTTCRGNAVNSTTGRNGGGIPSNNIWVTLGGNGNGEFRNSGDSGYDPRGQLYTHTFLPQIQVRGPRGYWTQNLTTCQWSMQTWINATWQAVGNQYQCHPVLQTRYSLTVEEGLILPPAPIWPDPRGHPTVVVSVDCAFNLASFPSCAQRMTPSLDPRCYCYVRPAQIFSLWEIITMRPLLFPVNQPTLYFKYTGQDTQNQYVDSNQGVFRIISNDAVAWGAGQEQGPYTAWVPAYNWFCQVADPQFAFMFNWGSWSYPNVAYPGVPPNSGTTVTYPYELSAFSCASTTDPKPPTSVAWQEDLNLCRGCQHYVDAGNHVLELDAMTFATLRPNNTWFNNPVDLCRLTFIPPGSDYALGRPLGDIFVLPFSG